MKGQDENKNWDGWLYETGRTELETMGSGSRDYNVFKSRDKDEVFAASKECARNYITRSRKVNGTKIYQQWSETEGWTGDKYEEEQVNPDVEKDELLRAIEVLEKPSKHIQLERHTVTGHDYFNFSADLVRAIEVAKELMREKMDNKKQNNGWISTKDDLPKEGEQVTVFVNGAEYPAEIHYGITNEQREKMKNGELPDPVEFLGDWSSTKRSAIIKKGDVHGNNTVPYSWTGPGPFEWFGQDIKFWRPISPPQEEKELAENSLEEKKQRLEELKKTRCAQCASSGDPNDMWCWNLPHCHCEVKALREEIEGECNEPMDMAAHIDSILTKQDD